MVVNGFPHGPEKGTTVCQLYLRHFQEGAHIHIEPWRSRVFPVIKDLVVDRSVLDRMMRAGGFISVPTGSAPEANTVPVPKEAAEVAMDAAACIGCGACVAACPNGAAALFVSARLGHLGLLPQGQPERERRAKAMIRRMDREGFGACGNHRECEAVCPKRISIRFIARANRDFLKAFFVHPGKA
jgi:succinate dehydrogenase / fumarate reductase iron-sulfur subunit